MEQIINLEKKNILITGASSGIGAETARLCSKLGARMILVARREQKLKEVRDQLSGQDHLIYSYDLSDLDGIEELVKKIVSDAGPLDGFVHSAGVSENRPLKMYKPRSIKEVMDINFASFVEITRCISKKNAHETGLSIVGVSSVASIMGGKGIIAYSASKAAMNAAVRCIAKELGTEGIRANTVCPAMIDTEIHQKTLSISGDSPEKAQQLIRQYLGVGKPSDVANMIAFLLSDASKLITGSNIAIDGGLLSS